MHDRYPAAGTAPATSTQETRDAAWFAGSILAPALGGARFDEDTATVAMRAIVRGDVPPREAAAFALALATRGETVPELAGMAVAVRDAALPVPVDDPSELVDTCGTGGDGTGTFNVSTTAALVIAAAGVRVAKHGNRAVSSACGSADVLAELGVCVDDGPSGVVRDLARHGIAFLSAPAFHPAFRHVSAARRELRTRTAFNLLGPLCNPARAGRRVLGVPRHELVEPMARVLHRLGVHRAMVLHSEDGMDELSLNAPAHVVELRDGELQTYVVHPGLLGLRPARRGELLGADAQTNATILRAVLDGEPGARRDIVLLNAAAALYLVGRAADLQTGLHQAADAIDSGSAAATLAAWVADDRRATGAAMPA